MAGGPVLQNCKCFGYSCVVTSSNGWLVDDNGKITEEARCTICASPNKLSLSSFNKIFNNL